MKTEEFENIVGHEIRKIIVEAAELTFITDKGKFTLLHDQDCCECVSMVATKGNLMNCIGKVGSAKVQINVEEFPDRFSESLGFQPYESFTWTIFSLTINKKHVKFYWLGESNGYYSESVYCYYEEL